MHGWKLLAAGVAAAAVAAPAQAGAVTTLVGSGSSVAQPYLEALFAGYKHVNPKVKFSYNPDGGNAGVQDVQNGTSQFAVNTRPPLSTDHGTVYNKLFLDGLCIAVNPKNKLTNLKIRQARDIFTGVKTQWTQFPGSRLKNKIDAFGRDATAGSYTFFQQAVLNGQTQSSSVQPLAKDGLVANAIAHDVNGIGYVGLAHTKPGEGVKKLKLNGRQCAAKDIKTLRYPLSRYIWFVTPARGANTQVQKFGQWIKTSHAAGVIIRKAGAVPAFNK